MSEDEIDEDIIDLGIQTSEAPVARQNTQILNSVLLVSRLLRADKEAVKKVISAGIDLKYVSSELRDPVSWLVSEYSSDQEMPSMERFTATHPEAAIFLSSVADQDRSLTDVYKSLKHSSMIEAVSNLVADLSLALEKNQHQPHELIELMAKQYSDVRSLATTGRNQFEDGSYITKTAKEAYERALRGEAQGMPIPFPFIDQSVLGLQTAKIFVILGEPNAGKTWLAGMMILSLVTGNRFKFSSPRHWGESVDTASVEGFEKEQERFAVRVLGNSLEMSNEEMSQRLIALNAKVNYGEMLSGELDEDGFNRFRRSMTEVDPLLTENLRIGHATNLDTVISEAEDFGAQVIVNDAFYLIEGPEEKRWERVQSAMAKMRDHSLRTGVTYILTTQLDENNKNRAMFSQAIKQDADIIITAKKAPSDMIILELTKARNARVGTAYRYDMSPTAAKYGQVSRVDNSTEAVGDDVRSSI